MKLSVQKIISGVTIVSMLLVAMPVTAMPNTNRVVATNERSGRTVVIPEHAVLVADNVFSLGTSIDPVSGKKVEGLMIIDKKKGNAKGGAKGKPDKPGDGGGEETCYAFLANGASWKSTEDYILDPSNRDSMSEAFVRGVIADAVEVWDSEVATDVFGVEVTGVVDGADELSPDGKNEVMFDDIDSVGTVGVTIVWGIFRGKPSERMLVEWDQVYDDSDYDFGDADINPLVMDMKNVAVHEMGHASGMGHPSDSCTEETMYRFVEFGETIRRDLNAGDIAGINALY